MKNNPHISVIVPAHNEEKNIAACLKSLTRQKTKVPYEVILVDNNSSDTTAKIAREFSVRLVREKKLGRAYARGRGVAKSKGKILAFTEADCRVPATWVDFIASYFRDHPAIIGFSGSYRFIDSSLFLSFIGPLSLIFSSWLYRLFTGNYTFRGTNFAVKKSILKKIGNFNPESVPLDDVESGFRARKLGPIHFLPHFYVKTSDRRLKGRMMKFLFEFSSSFIRIFLLKGRGNDNWYQPIR